ncbi:MAG: M23 family metallopeptidase [Clostridia bacterium]|nr:M23 family metallopeptidase [Clostridia bacterium]
MSEKKTVPVLNFIKKNLYYLLIGASLIVIATVIAIILASGKTSPSQSGATSEKLESTPQSQPESERESASEPDSAPEQNESVPDKPVNTKVVFTMPVASSTIIKDYTSSTVVFNQTLGVYTGHMGIDFGAEAGAEVVSAYAGTVESITTSYLQGTTVTIDHGNGLKSIYNSIEALDTLEEGQSVVAGQAIGTVSDNNRQEYKDGPHLHFEVTLNGERVDPDEYLMLAEK